MNYCPNCLKDKTEAAGQVPIYSEEDMRNAIAQAAMKHVLIEWWKGVSFYVWFVSVAVVLAIFW